MVFLVPFEYRHIFLVRYTIGFSLIFILLFYLAFIYYKRTKHYNTRPNISQTNPWLPKQRRNFTIDKKYDESDYCADG